MKGGTDQERDGPVIKIYEKNRHDAIGASANGSFLGLFNKPNGVCSE